MPAKRGQGKPPGEAEKEAPAEETKPPGQGKPPGEAEKGAPAEETKPPGEEKPPGEAEKGAPAAVTKPPGPPRCTILLASTVVRRVLETVAILSICITIAVFILYFLENQEVTTLNQAVAEIREYLQKQNESNFNKSDLDILAEAIRQSNILASMNKRNIDASRKISSVWQPQPLFQPRFFLLNFTSRLLNTRDKIITLMNEGWKSFQGHLYYFNIQDVKLSHLHAKEDCEHRTAVLAVITSDEEEEFVVQNVKHAETDMWIGVEEVGKRWKFVTGDQPSKLYWGRQPTKPFGTERECVEIKRQCNERLNCWFKAKCFELRHWICEMEPDPELIH